MSEESYTIADEGDALTVRISGAAYRNIWRMAEAMNRADRRMGAEADADNTAETVFWNFILEAMRTDGEAEAREQAFGVADGVDAPPELAEAMRAEFRAERFE
jgi:hypothetical protein